MTLRLHYRDDRTPFDGSQILGPDTDHALYKATTAVYDPDTDCTVVTVKPLLGDDRKDAFGKLIPQQRMRERLQRLFVGPSK